MTEPSHMIIPVTVETRPFWTGCAQGKLLFQSCGNCGEAQFYPRKTCVACSVDAIEWCESKRRGEIFSFTVLDRAPTPAFKAEAPYIVALIDMEEGFRIMLNIVGTDRFDAAIGGKVRVGFVTRDNGDVLPVAELVP